LAYAFLWEYSHKRLKLVQLLGQLGVFLTFWQQPRRGKATTLSKDCLARATLPAVQIDGTVMCA
jgi:hypothetical protein